jgi:anti-sigma B factor antagonist
VSPKTSIRQASGIAVVDCSGRIALGEGSVILKEGIRELLSKGRKKSCLISET